MGEVHQEIELPDGSIYLWMYRAGLRQVPLGNIEAACHSSGIQIRAKDYENYWNGYYRSDIYIKDRWKMLFKFPELKSMESMDWSALPMHPYANMPEIENRYVPCNEDNRPMIKWGNGCLSQVDASCYPNQVYLAENLVGTKRVVIDCDGDHDDALDMDVIDFLWKLTPFTHTMSKPKAIRDYEGYEATQDLRPASFHLTFYTDRVVPTLHMPWCHMDIIGNKRNSLRYFKNKVWNGMPAMDMTEEIWSAIQEYSRTRKYGG